MVAKTFEYPAVPGATPDPGQAIPILPRVNDLHTPAAHANEPAPKPAKPAEPTFSKKDLDAAYERGCADARRDAEAQFNERLQQAEQSERARVSQAVAEFQQSNADYFGKVEVQLVHLAMAIAGKILHREAQVDPLLVAALVRVATEKLKQGSLVQVRIRPEEISAWRKYFDESGNNHVAIELIEDAALEAGQCVLHSEVGTAELGIDAQLKEIENGLFDLLSQRPQNG